MLDNPTSSPVATQLSTISASCVRPPLIGSAGDALAAAEAFATGIADGAIMRDRTGALPVQELAAFDRSGLLAITIPRAYGGSGMPPVVLADVARIVASVDPAIAQAAQGHFFVVDVLRAVGSNDLRARLFDDFLNGRRAAAAISERGGQHSQDLSTRLRGWHESGGDRELRLDGRKYYATGALTADWLAVTAVDDAGETVLAFVECDADGMTLDHDWDSIGQRATVSGGVTFESVAVDPSLVLPYGRCFETPQQFGARAQLYHAAIQVGIAIGALGDARDFLRSRARPSFEAVNGGWAHTATDDPHTIHRFGELSTRVAAAQALLRDAAGTLAEVGLTPVDADSAARGSVAVARAKAFASDVAGEVAGDIFSLTGANAADRRYDLDRHWRNARTHAGHDPVDWKFHHIGDHALNGTTPPNHGQL